MKRPLTRFSEQQLKVAICFYYLCLMRKMMVYTKISKKTTKGIIFEGNAKNVKMLLIPGVESDWGIPR